MRLNRIFGYGAMILCAALFLVAVAWPGGSRATDVFSDGSVIERAIDADAIIGTVDGNVQPEQNQDFISRCPNKGGSGEVVLASCECAECVSRICFDRPDNRQARRGLITFRNFHAGDGPYGLCARGGYPGLFRPGGLC